MNKKGFTLVEILSVIVVLSIVIILAYPAISSSFNKSKNQISDLNKKSIKEAAEVFAQEVYICDSSSNIINDLNEIYKANLNCKDAREKLNNDGITITLEYLKEKDYLSDKVGNCNNDGKVTVKMEEGIINTTLHSNITCN